LRAIYFLIISEVINLYKIKLSEFLKYIINYFDYNIKTLLIQKI